MSFGYSILGFGAYPTRGEPDVSNVLIEDDNGNDNCYTKEENSSGSFSTTHNHNLQDPIELVGGVSGGYEMVLHLNSTFTGNAAAYAWTITENSDPLNNVSISTNTATTADFDAVFAISSGAGRGQPPAEYTIELAVTGTNTNVITKTYSNIIMIVP